MIAVNIGRKLLELYNQENEEHLSPKDFFEKVYFELFYNHSKYMQWVTNSPFVQMKKGQKPDALTEVERQEKLLNLHEKIGAGLKDASIAIGFPASEEKEFATTSGQVSALAMFSTVDDVYCSWIGSGLGIGVAGGLSIFFKHPKILMTVFKGWQYYREYLNDATYTGLRGNQINTWNGQWLSHVFSRDYRAYDPLQNFNPFGSIAGGGLELTTASWTSVLFGISRTLPNTDLTGYVYSLGQTNKTLGFVPFRLPQIQRPIQLYKKLFNDQYHQDAKRIEPLYGTAFSFQRACQMGAIGVQALEPKGLRGLIPTGKDAVSLPNFSKADQEKFISFRTYQTWLLAMLNNDELWDTAGEAAQAFLQYEAGAGKARKDRSNKVKSVLDTARKPQFMRELAEIVEEADNKDVLVELGKTVNRMPADNVSYFITLIRFRYAEFSSKPVQEPVK
ncbi:hypothetical protein [Pontibacter sp. SGAir0037]|uniref:hypothetical protein n=1 Tax=Pontibacter sp. SGAir0037 TaxID=2571030 RepID=UPI0010CD1FEB|nr:hypothetical protein [Pontibacter sp. SGAir0037]QCR22114.1 hypothetical protein C1N53_07005 [Pontibacter sp. SGAir0037]